MQVGLNNSTMLNNINQNKEAQNSSANKLSKTKEEETVDPAIAMIANAMMSDIVTDSEGVKNANTASAMMQIADGALSQVSDQSVKLQELSVASNNGALNASDRSALQAEFDATVKSMDMTISSATFNGKELFGQDMSFSLGSSDISINLQDINTSTLDINSQDSIKEFTKQINSVRSDVGSTQKSIQDSAENLLNSMTQKSASANQILDSSDLAQAHKNNLSSQKVATLLE
ncbi:MAG: hypothetical protein ABGW74_01905 [Campylobacterales bacterium]|jgi:flagellin